MPNYYRKCYEVVGYAYDAAVHCVECAHKHFLDPNRATDGYGNLVTRPVFLVEALEGQEHCDDCGAPLTD